MGVVHPPRTRLICQTYLLFACMCRQQNVIWATDSTVVTNFMSVIAGPQKHLVLLAIVSYHIWFCNMDSRLSNLFFKYFIGVQLC